MRLILGSVAAAGILVAGAFAASAVIDAPAAALQDAAAVDERPERHEPGQILDEVLSELVADGTLDQSEADAVKAAMTERVEEIRAEREAWREENPGRFHRHGRHHHFMGGIFEDGVIDAEEFAALPDEHPLKDPDLDMGDLMDDGELSLEDLRELHGRIHDGGFRFRGESSSA